ncbi:MAG TPA: FAD-dependent oxidoreductase, partial [Aquihabitans sp.]|nr:FAD-dependent oxidoreductase [Aquihabitans sp.]
EIVVLEMGSRTSYSACGIPYLVGGAVDQLDDLVVRTPQEFRDQHRIDVRTRHRAMAIDLDSRRVEVRAVDQQRTFHLGFDLLHLATGAEPIRPPLPGIDAPWIHGVQNLEDAAGLLHAVEADPCKRVVVVGGGYIGLEMAEAFIDRGSAVALVDVAPRVMGMLDPEFGDRIGELLSGYGVDVRLGVGVEGFGDHVVHTADGDLPADLVVLGLGVRPAASLGLGAGLRAGAKGAIGVDHRQRTSSPGIYAAGDCADTFHLVSRERVHIALGTVANKAGRVAGVNLGGGYATFPGVLGTAVTRICEVEVARTGLTEAEARAAGIEFVTGTAEATSRAGYFPGAEPVTAKVMAERGTGRLLGGQIIGADRVGKRIDTMATAITARLTVAELLDLDLAYAPSVSPLTDPFQVAARSAAAALAPSRA